MVRKAVRLSVLVTGGCGFVGGPIVDAIQKQHDDWDVTVFDKIRPSRPRSKVTYIQGEVTSQADVEDALAQAKPRVVIHVAVSTPFHGGFCSFRIATSGESTASTEYRLSHLSSLRRFEVWGKFQ